MGKPLGLTNTAKAIAAIKEAVANSDEALAALLLETGKLNFNEGIKFIAQQYYYRSFKFREKAITAKSKEEKADLLFYASAFDELADDMLDNARFKEKRNV